MKQIDGNQSKRLIFILLLLLGCAFSLCALSLTNSQLLGLFIEQATEAELRDMALLRNIPQGSSSEMRDSLYAYHNVHALPVIEKEDSAALYTMTIVHADTVTTDRKVSSVVTLEGRVEIQFSLPKDETGKHLKANKVIVDVDNTLVVAYGNVLLDDGRGETVFQGEVLSLDWSEDTLIVMGGTSSTERKNSDGEIVRFYTTGDRITYAGNGDGVYFDQGFLTTNKKHAYSSIKADQLSFLAGGDLYVRNATLMIGRVPVLWMPVFFFPGSRMVGNPAMGFSSDRGMFLNTTYELYGTYPHFSETQGKSFTSLFSGEAEEGTTPSGVLYRNEQKTLSPFDRWVQQSSSYLVLMADTYEYSGISLAMEAHHSFLSGTVVLDNSMCIAVHPDGSTELSSYEDFPKLRAYGQNRLVIAAQGTKLKLNVPFYTDPSVQRLYGNRLSTFAFDSLLGVHQDFPLQYSGDVHAFSWTAEGSFSLDTKRFGSFVKEASISSLNAVIDWQWQKQNDFYGYKIQKLTLPELRASVRGELFSWSKPLTQSSGQQPTAQLEVGPLEEKEDEEQEWPLSLDPTLDPLYIPAMESRTKALTALQNRSLTLRYDLTESFSYSVQSPQEGVASWQEKQVVSSLTIPNLTLDAVLDPRYFTLSQKFSAPILTNEDQTKTTFLTRQFQLTSLSYLTVPVLGLSYTLEGRLYTFKDSFTATSHDVQSTHFAFTKDHITRHQLRLAKTFSLGSGKLSPSLTANLYPLPQSLLPALGYEIGPWSMGSSLRMVEKDGVFAFDVATSTLRYKSNPFSLSLTGSYDFKNAEIDRWAPYSFAGNSSLSLFSHKVTLQESFTFTAYSPLYGNNYFKDITTTFSIPSMYASLVYAGPVEQLFAEKLITNVALQNLSFQWWKRRIRLDLGLDARLSFSFVDPTATSLSLIAKAGFSIAEFLDLRISLTSTNQGFSRYYEGNNFSFPLLWEDLMRSFDFSGGGRGATQFNMSSVSIELVHHMEDWSLNCKYSGSVVLWANQYKWVPVVSVFLQWKTIPELKVDEIWTRTAETWTPASSS